MSSTNFDSNADEEISAQREQAYTLLSDYSRKRIQYYRGEASTKPNVSMLLNKDVVLFAARGIRSADEFVEEAFHACESSSEETVMGSTWQAIVSAISSNTIDSGDLTTVRDGNLYVCELKSQTNTVNSSSFPQELRELKDRVTAQERFRRASNQKVLPAFCVLRGHPSFDEWRIYRSGERDFANRDLNGFSYRYLVGAGFWRWLTGFDSVEGLIDDLGRIETDDVVEARADCLKRLKVEMRRELEKHGLPYTIEGVFQLKRILHAC